jgi:hypothetical protein
MGEKQNFLCKYLCSLNVNTWCSDVTFGIVCAPSGGKPKTFCTKQNVVLQECLNVFENGFRAETCCSGVVRLLYCVGAFGSTAACTSAHVPV